MAPHYRYRYRFLMNTPLKKQKSWSLSIPGISNKAFHEFRRSGNTALFKAPITQPTLDTPIWDSASCLPNLFHTAKSLLFQSCSHVLNETKERQLILKPCKCCRCSFLGSHMTATINECDDSSVIAFTRACWCWTMWPRMERTKRSSRFALLRCTVSC